MFVIGTAGHVDHGKSSLVHALTGIDPDRLAEEKRRALTIDLGFAWLQLPDIADEVGIIDVPGHRDFIENMLAGIGGIDLALLVVAADEGVMPQTREHLAILDLLSVTAGVIALTKVDLIDDPEWLELVELDILEAVEDTVLAGAPLLPVSAISGQGLDQLRAALSEQLLQHSRQDNDGRPRLPIDRVFSISGFGVVVTGTLTGGALRIGDEIILQPHGHRARIRGLQMHKTQVDVARPGSRIAVNVSGVDIAAIERGDVITGVDAAQPTQLIDASYRQLADAAAALRHNEEVKLFVGAAEHVARTRVLGGDQIPPGEQGYIQLALREPAFVVRGDRFIVRRPSPPATLGGGVVLDPHPGRQHRRLRPQTLERLQTLASGTPQERLLQALKRRQPASAAELAQRSAIAADEVEALLATLSAANRLLLIDGRAVTTGVWQDWQQQLRDQLSAYHKANPLRSGMPREEPRSRLGLSPTLFDALCADANVISDQALLRLPEHSVQFDERQQQQIDRLMAQLTAAGVNAMTVADAQALVGAPVYAALLEQKRLTAVSAGIVWRSSDFDAIVQQTVDQIRTTGAISAAELRDLLGTSRKYAIALLEHLDKSGVTRRVGDKRVLTRG